MNDFLFSLIEKLLETKGFEMSRLRNKNIIITGASGGIGEHLAWRIAKLGGTPILIARSEEKLAAITTSIVAKYKREAFYYCTDLTDQKELKQTVELIVEKHGYIDGVVNNAGAGKFQYAWEEDQHQVEWMFRINVFAVMEVNRLLLPLFIKQGHGHILIVASQAGKMATPKSSTYAASKHAIIGYANALRMELEDKGIIVTTVNPGPVETGFFAIADPDGKYKKQVQRFMLKPEYVAKKIAGSLLKRKREINLPLWMEAGSRIHHLMPGVVERVLKRSFHKK